MELQTRRRVGLLIRIGLVLGTCAIVVGWMLSKVPRPQNVSVVQAPAAEALGPGDLQILSSDGNISLILKGDKVMGGLSPATIARAREKMAESMAKDSSGLGGMIAGIVKSSVSSVLEWHVSYPVAEIARLSFVDGQLVVTTLDGEDHQIRINEDQSGRRSSEPPRFSVADAERFVAAFEKRKRDMGR